MKVVMVGPFGLKVKSTMRERALPMAHALVKRGHHVTLIIPPWDSPDDAGQTWVDDGVQVINVSLPAAKGGFFHLALTAALVRLVLQHQPDVVHLFKPKAYAGLTHILLHTLRRLGRHAARLVVDEDDWERAWNAIEPYPPLQKRLFAWQEPWGLTHADALTVASKNLQYYAETLGVPLKKIAYVPNGVRAMEGPVTVLRSFWVWQKQLAAVASGIDVAPAEGSGVQPAGHSYGESDFEGRVRAQYNLFGQPIILLYTRFFEFGLDFLLAVAKEVHKQMPAARWLVVGRGFFGEEKRLHQMVKAEGLANRFIFTGWVPMADLPHYFAAANVAVYPYDDTPINRTKCSVKLLDLLSAGVPVVASKVGQNGEYIRHRQTGVLVPPGNPQAMAQAVVAILSSGAVQRIIGQDAVRDVHHRFSWESLVEKVEAIYSAT